MWPSYVQIRNFFVDRILVGTWLWFRLFMAQEQQDPLLSRRRSLTVFRKCVCRIRASLRVRMGVTGGLLGSRCRTAQSWMVTLGEGPKLSGS